MSWSIHPSTNFDKQPRYFSIFAAHCEHYVGLIRCFLEGCFLSFYAIVLKYFTLWAGMYGAVLTLSKRAKYHDVTKYLASKLSKKGKNGERCRVKILAKKKYPVAKP